MSRKEKVLKIVCGILFGAGLLLIIGTAGAADCNYIDLHQMATQGGIGAALMFFPIAIGVWRGW